MDNVRRLLNIIDMPNQTDDQHAILLLDAETAFWLGRVYVSWSVLKCFGFGPILYIWYELSIQINLHECQQGWVSQVLFCWVEAQDRASHCHIAVFPLIRASVSLFNNIRQDLERWDALLLSLQSRIAIIKWMFFLGFFFIFHDSSFSL